jgi:hypothetical protein
VSTELLEVLFPMEKAVRLLGVSLSGFTGESLGAPQMAFEI